MGLTFTGTENLKTILALFKSGLRNSCPIANIEEALPKIIDPIEETIRDPDI